MIKTKQVGNMSCFFLLLRLSCSSALSKDNFFVVSTDNAKSK